MNTKSPLLDQLDLELKKAYTDIYLDHTLQDTDESIDKRTKLILGILKYHEGILLTSSIDLTNFSAPVTPVIIPGFGYLQLFAQEYGSNRITFQLMYCGRFCFVAPLIHRNLADIPFVKELTEYLSSLVTKEPVKKADLVVTLRNITGSSLMECKNALQQVGWNLIRAQDYLRYAGTGRLTDTFTKQY